MMFPSRAKSWSSGLICSRSARTIAESKPRLEIHELGIGGKPDPVRMVFDSIKGNAINACLIDMGNRFRLIANEVTSVEHPDLPKLPVARAVWQCKPDFKNCM